MEVLGRLDRSIARRLLLTHSDCASMGVATRLEDIRGHLTVAGTNEATTVCGKT